MRPRISITGSWWWWVGPTWVCLSACNPPKEVGGSEATGATDASPASAQVADPSVEETPEVPEDTEDADETGDAAPSDAEADDDAKANEIAESAARRLCNELVDAASGQRPEQALRVLAGSGFEAYSTGSPLTWVQWNLFEAQCGAAEREEETVVVSLTRAEQRRDLVFRAQNRIWRWDAEAFLAKYPPDPTKMAPPESPDSPPRKRSAGKGRKQKVRN